MQARRGPVENLLLARPPAEEEGQTQNEQDVPDDRARDRRLHDLELALEDEEEGDDHLRHVAEGGVEKTSLLRPDANGEVLRGVTDDSGKREDPEGRHG